MRVQSHLITVAIVSLVMLFVIGVFGYSLIESNWSFTDALYMTVITLTTVGYDDLGMSQNGRLFTVFLLLGGIGIFLFAVGTLTTFTVAG